MESLILEAESRETLSNGGLKGLRKQGWVPAVLYGGYQGEVLSQNRLLKVPEKSLIKTLGKHNAVVELKIGTETAPVVIKEIQKHIITQKPIHVDFQIISMTEKLEVMVPVHFVGESPGVKLHGGILQHVVRELKVSALPKDIPQEIPVDVSQLDIGHGIAVSQLTVIPGVQILVDPHQLVANVVAPTILEETTAAAAPATTEPEVIAKGKKPEEEAEAAPAKPGEKPAASPAKTAAPPAK